MNTESKKRIGMEGEGVVSGILKDPGVRRVLKKVVTKKVAEGVSGVIDQYEGQLREAQTRHEEEIDFARKNSKVTKIIAGVSSLVAIILFADRYISSNRNSAMLITDKPAILEKQVPAKIQEAKGPDNAGVKGKEVNIVEDKKPAPIDIEASIKALPENIRVILTGEKSGIEAKPAN